MSETRALILFDEKNRFYYTSFLSSFGCVIVCGEKRIFITDKRYVTDAVKQSAGCEVVPLGEQGLYADIKKQLDALNVRKVGYESKLLSVAEFDKLCEVLEGCEFEPADDEIAEAQAIKRADEIDKIAKAEWITQKALMTASIHSSGTHFPKRSAIEQTKIVRGSDHLLGWSRR